MSTTFQIKQTSSSSPEELLQLSTSYEVANNNEDGVSGAAPQPDLAEEPRSNDLHLNQETNEMGSTTAPSLGKLRNSATSIDGPLKGAFMAAIAVLIVGQAFVQSSK